MTILKPRRTPVQNVVVAKQMSKFFRKLPRENRDDPVAVAQAYGWHLFNKRRLELVDDKKLSRSPFHVGLGISGSDFIDITKRSVLVCDTLLLSHDPRGPLHALGIFHGEARNLDNDGILNAFKKADVIEQDHLSMRCPDLATLGQWLIETESLLKAGLAWYLPNYAMTRGASPHGSESQIMEDDLDVPSALDFLVQNGKAISRSGSNPAKSAVVRPVLQIDLPFLEGVTLRDFSEITVNEFSSYSEFRGFLRQSFLDLDEAINDIYSERELIKIGHKITSEIRSVESQMRLIRRKRAVSVTGAGMGTIGATLVAVYGPALQQALAILGVAGAAGVWGMIQSALQDSPKSLRENKWYYVWALAQKSERY